MIKKIIAAIWGIHIITVEQSLSDEQYDRLKNEINENWPLYIERPLLVEGGAKVTRL